MNFDEYQTACRRTMNPDLTQRDAILNYTIGIGGEAGEVLEAIKKITFHGKQIAISEVGSEISDCLWYLAALADTLGLNLGELAEANIAKLKARYPIAFNFDRADGT